MLSAAARANVSTAAIETYDAGMDIFFSSPVATMVALRQMLESVAAGGGPLNERSLCSRCETSACTCVCARACVFAWQAASRTSTHSVIDLTYSVIP